MPTLHAEYITILEAFARLFSKRIWEHARILLIGAILSPAERSVTAAFPKGHTALAYGAHLPWRAVPGSVGTMCV